jgi:hypothetical protein
MQHDPLTVLCSPGLKGIPCDECNAAIGVWLRCTKRMPGEEIPRGCTLSEVRLDLLVKDAQAKLRLAYDASVILGTRLPAVIDMCQWNLS